MNKTHHRFYAFTYNAGLILSLILALLLMGCSLIFTSYSTDMTTQTVLIRYDSIPMTLCGLVLCLVLSYLWFRSSISSGHHRLLLLVAAVWFAGFGILLVLCGRTVPAADALSVYRMAESFAEGDLSAVDPYSSYLSYYPQQIGLSFFFQMIISVWNMLGLSLQAFHIIKCFYVLLLWVITYLSYRITCLMTEDSKAPCFVIILCMLNLPFIMYSSFVYSEIPSYALVLCGYLLFLEAVHGLAGNTVARNTRLIFSVIALSLSVLVRKNSLIMVIAVLIVVFPEFIKEHKPALMIYGLALLIASNTILPATLAIYEKAAGSTLTSGVTATSYIAMGMQEGGRGAGWYNGFNFNTYQNCGMDPKLANEISREAINERLQVFRDEPAYAFSFYMNKFLSQWTDGTYASRQATLADYGGRTDFMNSVYNGQAGMYFIEYCNIYQNIIYLGTVLFLIMALKKRKTSFGTLPDLLCIIACLGGFLFHMLWEANSRYIFLYSLLLIPYAASGLQQILQSKKPEA